MNWVDLFIVIYVIIFIVVGIKHGLMTSVLSNFSLSINCIISFFFYKPFAFIYNKIFHIGDAIYNSYYTSLLEKNSTNLTANLLTQSSNLKNTIDSAINDSGMGFVPKTMFKIFLKNKKGLSDVLVERNYTSRNVAQIISQTFANFYVTIIAFVTSLILIYIIVWIFKTLAEKLRTIGFVKGVDNCFGALYGVLRCFISLIIICCIINILSSFSFMTPVIEYINSSFCGKFIYSQINEFMNNYLSLSDIISSIFN